MTWTVRQTVTGKRPHTKDIGEHPTREAAQAWRDRVIGPDARGFDVVRVGEGA